MTRRTRFGALVCASLLTGVGTIAACGDRYDSTTPEGAAPIPPNAGAAGDDLPGGGVPSADMPGSAAQNPAAPASGAEPAGAEGPPPVAGIDTSGGGAAGGAGGTDVAGSEETTPGGTGGEEQPPGEAQPPGEEPPVDVPVVRPQGPCDLFAAGNTPCVAAYSTVRALSSTYQGPLYQVRRGAPNAFQNTGTGGVTQDIGILPNGLADAAAQQAFCGNQSCTVATVYDQSGRGNDLTVAKRGLSNGGQFAASDDFESNAAAGPLTVGGNAVFSLFMEARQGYRQAVAGNGVPRGQAAQGVYMLADGTRSGTACCWDFGNVTPDPTQYHTMNTLFFGTAFWGRGAGNGPWFMADFEAGVWAGGSNPGEPGWGALSEPAPANAQNPSLRVRFALGFLRTSDASYALRMANVESATNLSTAYEGALPKPMDNQGAIVLGVGGDNSNNSFGTFYEGAVVAGYPAANVELSVMQNIQSVGYGR